MKIEHIACQVEDPLSAARWYTEHLGLRVKRAHAESPFAHFLADDGDAVMLEFYKNPAVPVPDYWRMDPLLLHIAFQVNDPEATRARLVAAGATALDEVQTTPSGDRLAMLRDPWGLPVQLVRREERMIPG